MKKIKDYLRGAVPLFCCLLFGLDSLAQSYLSTDSELIVPRAYVSTGISFPEITTTMRVDSKSGLGTEIGLENDFKLNNKLSVFQLEAMVRLKEKSQIVFGYTNLNRGNSFQFEQDVNFGDTTFYAGASADLNFDVYYYALTWRYSFFDKPNWNAGLSLGARVVQFKANLEADVNARTYSQGMSVAAPAILIGVHAGGYLTPRLLGRYSLEYFQVSFSGVDINILETDVSLQYFFLENLSIGGGYATNTYKVNEVPLSDNFSGKVLFAFSGFNLFLSARF
ncbi:hypothetical protein [Owenweeksia hongkongensis]|uniref:hypothetical protein n=1 Tax=Owenweeksia hongkongensis TaxID=253245 RepID=UPI003A90AA67